MKSSILGAVLAMSVIAVAIPTTELVKISKRNPCDGIDATPVLYHQYEGDVCPPPITMLPSGECPGIDYYKNQCAAFCQVRTNFVYGTEVPFPNSYCHGPFTCSIAETNTVTLTYSAGLTVPQLKALGLGVSGGFSYGSATAKARTYSVTLQPGSCGYFTLVPVQKDTCGTMTTADVHWVAVDGALSPWCGNANNIGNYCASEARTNSDGSIDSETIFVKTNCSTREPLPSEEQDPVYQNPGVPLDRGVLANLLSTWPDAGTTTDPGASSTTSSPSPSSTPNMSSAACKTCDTNLGASSCAASDNQCLINQCKNDSNCQACAIDCTTVG